MAIAIGATSIDAPVGHLEGEPMTSGQFGVADRV